MIEFGHIKLFTADEVARQLGTTAARIRNFIKQGQLTARRVGRTYYITEKKLEEFLECAPVEDPPAATHSEEMADDISRIDAILGKNDVSQGLDQ